MGARMGVVANAAAFIYIYIYMCVLCMYVYVVCLLTMCQGALCQYICARLYCMAIHVFVNIVYYEQ